MIVVEKLAIRHPDLPPDSAACIRTGITGLRAGERVGDAVGGAYGQRGGLVVSLQTTGRDVVYFTDFLPRSGEGVWG